MLLCCVGCEEKEVEPLRVCVDLECVGTSLYSGTSDLESLVHALKSSIMNIGGPKDIEFEILPEAGVERDTAIKRIRTEIMSGEGPDVFIMAGCKKAIDSEFNSPVEEPLIALPAKAMESGYFLVLDEYMEKSTQFAEWDKMTRIVLEAGKNEEGQQIIPLCYRIPATVYSVKEVEHTPSKEITWMDMLESEDEALAAAAVWTDMDVFAATWNTVKDDLLFTDLGVPMTEFVLGELADYKQEKLLFTEEELRLRIKEICVLADNYLAGQYDSAPTHYCGFPGHNFNMNKKGADEEGQQYPELNGLKIEEGLRMIPLYSDDGGVTAEISAYAAINRNTKRADDAFFVLDYLLSRKAQQSEKIYHYLYCLLACGNILEFGGIPMYEDLMTDEYTVYWPAPNQETVRTAGNSLMKTLSSFVS